MPGVAWLAGKVRGFLGWAPEKDIYPGAHVGLILFEAASASLSSHRLPATIRPCLTYLAFTKTRPR